MISKSRYGHHQFYIPVMGTGFTIDTPVKVARYGVSSVISLSDDFLIEKMRRYHSARAGETFESIPANDINVRSRRITAYLNLVNRIVERQVTAMKEEPFVTGSDVMRYFELLPENPAKAAWRRMLAEDDPVAKARQQAELREAIVPGRIDVNIMTKVDPEWYRKGVKVEARYGLAQQALRGFAESDLRSAVVFSAGLNPSLYGAASEFSDFYPDEHGVSRKEIVLKVSDYRSAYIQGKFLAKKGLWVSEFRVESGINCGGHAFISEGHLMGPILDEFLNKRQELLDSLTEIYAQALAKNGRQPVRLPRELRITAQGGIGTHAEMDFLMRHYGVDATGWATPFLLVPEVVCIDDEHLIRLATAGEQDVVLSEASPLGVPFWLLRDSGSERNRRSLIEQGKPGSSCPRGYLKFNKDFTAEPICTASHEYQAKRLETEAVPADLDHGLLAKACLCRDLAGSALRIAEPDKATTPTICPGPNIANFSIVASFKEMVDHIYGRLSLLTNPQRPHMFIKEMTLYVERMRESLAGKPREVLDGMVQTVQEFEKNVLNGIRHYAEMAGHLAADKRAAFLTALENVRQEVERVCESVLSGQEVAVSGTNA